MIIQLERFDISMPIPTALDCSRPGKNDEAVDQALAYAGDQFDGIDPDLIREELREYGAWDEEELTDQEANMHRIFWLAACSAREALENAGCEAEDFNHLEKSHA